MTTTTPVLDELGFYTLAGQPASSRDLVTEVIDGEALGLGTAFISERYNKKEAAVLSGAAGAVSERITIETAATNHNTRHPMVTAGYARTMQSLTAGRFVLGLGRGIALQQDAFGMSRITTAQMEDFVGLMRRLFRGEVIIGHDGPAGSWPVLHLDAQLDEHLPMSLVAFGPETLALGGRCFDEVVLHTFFTDETTARCVQTVKQAAEEAGRDPASVRVWSCFATVGDWIPEDRAPHEAGRAAGHLPAGLRRPARPDQRVGPRRPRPHPGRPRRLDASAASTSWAPPSSSNTSPPSSPTSGSPPRPPATPPSASPPSEANSRWAATASSSTARPRPSSPRSSPNTAAQPRGEPSATPEIAVQP